MKASYKILTGDCIEQMAMLPKKSVHCVIFSPPYYGLRDYETASWVDGDADCDHVNPTTHQRQGKSSMRKGRSNIAAQKNDNLYRDVCGRCGAKRIDEQVGLELTPVEYIKTMVRVFRGIRRVLRNDGTVFINIGDSYCNSGSNKNGTGLDGKRRGGNTDATSYKKRDLRADLKSQGFKVKDRLGIPHRLVFALQDDGWYWRDEIVWFKPNGMPDSATDRCGRAHEFIFMLTKSPRYYYDRIAIQERAVGNAPGNKSHKHETAALAGDPKMRTKTGLTKIGPVEFRNKRSVWEIPVANNKEKHFAGYPRKLVIPCLLAGTSEKGCCPKCGAQWIRRIKTRRVATRSGKNSKLNAVVLHPDSPYRSHNGIVFGNRDPQRHQTQVKTIGWKPGCDCDAGDPIPCTVCDPFAGTGTTGAVAIERGRNAILIELNPEYVGFIKRKMKKATANVGFGFN